MTKMQDEVKALQLCQNKVRQKKLPMEVVDAEYQWLVLAFLFGDRCSHSAVVSIRDRRKLTFYFVADKRIDFRELVRELFRCALGHFYDIDGVTHLLQRLYKTRIWMASLQGPAGYEQ